MKIILYLLSAIILLTFIVNAGFLEYGLVAYGNDTSNNVSYRNFSGGTTSGNFSQQFTAMDVGARVNWTVIASSPVIRQFAVATRNDKGAIKIMLNDSGCWHNGSGCTAGTVMPLNVTLNATFNNTKTFDIAYEKRSGELLIVYSDNTTVPKFRVYNSSGWSAETSVPSIQTTGNISMVRLESAPGLDEIGLAYVDNFQRVGFEIWNGSENTWKCASGSGIGSLGGANKIQPNSSALVDIGWTSIKRQFYAFYGTGTTVGLNWTWKDNNSCTFNTGTNATSTDIGENVAVKSDPYSNRICVTGNQIFGDDLEVDIYDGDRGGADRINQTSPLSTDSSMNVESTPAIFHGCTWIGTTNMSIITYADSATATLDWRNYSVASNTFSATATTSFFASYATTERWFDLENYKDRNESMVLFEDGGGNLTAMSVNSTTAGNVWSNITVPGTGTIRLVLGTNFAGNRSRWFDYTPDNFLPGKLNATLMTGITPIYKEVVQNATFNVSVNISCIGRSSVAFGSSICGLVNGTIFYNLTAAAYPSTELNATAGDQPLYNFTAGTAVIPINISCGNMLDGNTCYVTWLVNATGYIGSVWLLNVTARSNLGGDIIINSTQQFTINIVDKPGKLNVSLMVPPQSFQLEVVNNTYFNVSANITCSDGDCGNVNGTVFWAPTAITNVELNGTAFNKPFYNFTNLVNLSCGNLISDGKCFVTWLVNASQGGSLPLNYFMNVTARSNRSDVVANFTINFPPEFQITIVKPTGKLNVTLMTPSNSPINVNQNGTFNVSANISCVGTNVRCGTVNGTIFYNLTTGAYPSTELNATAGDKPFYNFTTGIAVIPINISCGALTSASTCYVTWLVNATGDVNSVWLLNVTARSDLPVSNITVNSTQPNFRVNIIDRPGKLNVSLMVPTTTPLEVVNNTYFNVSANITCSNGDCGNVNGTIFYNLAQTYPEQELNATAGNKPFYNFTTGIAVIPINISCGNMVSDSKCFVTWLVNATWGGSFPKTYKLNVSARSDNSTVILNSTQPNFDITIVLPTGKLNVTLMNSSGYPASIQQNQTFNVSANISCVGTNVRCGTVNGTIFYNLTTGAYPSTELNGTFAHYPFHNATNLVNLSCGALTSASTCYVTWLVNATGDVNSVWLLNVTARSDLPVSNITTNSTQPAVQVTILDRPGKLNVSLMVPTTTPLEIVNNTYFNVSANITCSNGDCGNVNGTIFYNLAQTYPEQELNATAGNKPFYNFTTGTAVIPINISCGNMVSNGKCFVTWLVNATWGGSFPKTYKLNVSARSSNSNVILNSTQPNFEITIVLPTGRLNVTLMTPAAPPITAGQNQTFNVSANISCVGTNVRCGNVNGTIFYNLTAAAYPSTELNGTFAHYPFHNATNLVNLSCGALTSASTCYVTWLVNATGYIGSVWLLNVTARSDLPVSNITTNSSQPAFQVTIVAPVTDTFAFSILIVGASTANISNPIFPGNQTPDLWFNATGQNSKYVEPCRGGGSSCQANSTGTPIFIFKNTGTMSFNFTIVLNNTPTTGIVVFGSWTNNTDVTGCTGYSLANNGTTIDTTPIIRFAKAVCPGNETRVFLFANFTDVAAGIWNSTLNYSSNRTA